ncbi:thioesterase II family protein [Lacrimispora indolis]|uniref:thioesterase II family protein n=1 Tax=Lacrimispora indolis TaxID=69825 RepID=UPI0004A3220F|nr:thioesterase domain-containing protein [[Clostridium] methoxybenzovorans]
MSKWIAHEVRHRDGGINFISFPYAGGSPSMFAPWKSEIPETINFFPVLYPGRELRKSDPMPKTVDLFAKQFVDENQELFQNDFILFGHCTGTLLAYEVLLEVRRRFGKEPLYLLASGSESPRFLMTREREMEKRGASDEEMIDMMVEYELVDPDTARSVLFQKYYLPIYRMDLNMLSTYRFTSHEKLHCPIRVMYGKDDRTLRKEAVQDWEAFSEDPVEFKLFQGKHFYFAEDKMPLLGYVKELIEPFT